MTRTPLLGLAAAALVTLAGSGHYTIGVTAPLGMYELKDSDEQPDGCTWALEDADGNIQFQDQCPTVPSPMRTSTSRPLDARTGCRSVARLLTVRSSTPTGPTSSC